VTSLKIRTYREGDEAELTNLFNEYFKHFIHTSKTVDFWRWCYLKRPDVSPEGIFIAERANRIIGYAVVGIPKGGMHLARLYDYCFLEGDKATALELIGHCISFARKNKALGIIFVPCKQDEIALELCRKFGFISRPNKYYVLAHLINDFKFYEKIFDVLNSQTEKLPSCRKILEDLNSNLVIRLRPFQKTLNSYRSFTIQIQSGKFNLTSGETETFDAIVECDTTTFVKLLFGTIRLTKALIMRRIRISPLWKLPLVFKIFSRLPVPYPVYIPYGEWLTH